MKKELKRIEKLYFNGKLYGDIDEKGAKGYWELAGELVDMLVLQDEKNAGYNTNRLRERLQVGFYWVFQITTMLE